MKIDKLGGTVRTICGILCLLLILSTERVLSAYVGPKKKPRPLTAQEIVEQSQRKYARARFCKPRELDPAQIAHEFAPLIVEELKEKEDPPTPKMGVVDMARDRTLFQRRTVYSQTEMLQAGNQRLEQIYFLWAYEGGLRECFGTRDALLRGVRLILDPHGMPVLWEVLNDSNEDRIFFVAQSLEDAAKKQFGAALPGRHFAIERSIEEAPKSFVANVLEDGPVPMGPYVYVDSSPDRNITTVHCRCSPSQFDEAVETLEYHLEPVESLDKKWLRESGGVDLDKLLSPEPLDKLFRWPKLPP